ncbi:conserved hypothetical protein [Paenibacillus curdlanolyticus YK9]|uniref:Spore coat protein D n=1 Tax=Paenibacillus curdlanolyticus YK9 TaxID=717606 RepID=E0IGJ6_9BACL|nr:hypothetical protein [Paenibacillus curdlanolyticus]EFM08400.1 conserved hypothetical protein [Paenibacillus curdlanolyticus YK9]
MSNCHPHKPHCPQLDPVVVDPVNVYKDFYYSQPYDVVHPINIINQHHCVPCPHHVTVVTETDVMGNMMGPGMMPGMRTSGSRSTRGMRSARSGGSRTRGSRRR